MKSLQLVALGLLLLGPKIAWAQAGWVITDFQSDIQIQADGVVAVTETIAVDFGQLEKHGIYRDLPYVYYREAGDVYTRISDIEVRQDDEPAEVEVTRNDANMRIRVGDPDATISGKHTYVISYRVTGVLQNFGEVDELNWNVTGNDWEAPITAVTTRVSVPATVVRAACYVGGYGSNQACDQIDAEDHEVVASASALPSGEGLTVAVGYRPGIVPVLKVGPPPTVWRALLSPVGKTTAAVVAILGLMGWLRHWYMYGRDRAWRGTISPEYESPQGLRPAELGVLLDERADALDVSATIVDLASRGFLSITEEPKKWIFGSRDYVFARTNKQDTELRAYERELLTRLFDDGTEVRLSALKNTFYRDLTVVKDKLYDEVVEQRLFARRPDRIKMVYGLVGGALVGVGGVVLVLLFNHLEAALQEMVWHAVVAGLGVGILVSGVVGVVVSPFMPRTTAYGREQYERALGYKLFVSGTEKYRAKFYENNQLFVDVLPYAIVFGVTDQLARAFKDMGIIPPQPLWFHGVTPFNPTVFAGSMDSFSKSLSSALQSSPSKSSSGGGGFSGGGFGGGGGGSW